MINEIKLKDLTSNLLVLIAMILLIVLVLTAIVGPFLVTYRPDTPDCLGYLRD